MCVINLTLNTTTPAGTTLTNSQGRYRKVGTTTWTNFVVNLSDPKTPNITELGQYQLEVNVTNSLGVVSSWAASTFEVTNTCGNSTPITTTPTNGRTVECNIILVSVANNYRLENCTIGVTYQLSRNGTVVKTLQATGPKIIFQAPPGGFGSGQFIASNVALFTEETCLSNTINK